jgi:response regulator RpfG family c-di-GMP phosphodiesterase
MAQCKVLVVDDEFHSVQVVAISCGTTFEVFTAENGDIAYRLACEQNPVIVHHRTTNAVLSGIELIEKLRRNPATENMPVVN